MLCKKGKQKQLVIQLQQAHCQLKLDMQFEHNLNQ